MHLFVFLYAQKRIVYVDLDALSARERVMAVQPDAALHPLQDADKSAGVNFLFVIHGKEPAARWDVSLN